MVHVNTGHIHPPLSALKSGGISLLVELSHAGVNVKIIDFGPFADEIPVSCLPQSTHC